MKPSPTFNNCLVIGIAALVILAPALLFVKVRCVYGFMDENTGSQKGYSQWVLGIKTNEWYRESALETFMRKEFPAQFHQRWTSCQGDDRNIYNGILRRHHGMPGAIKQFGFHPEVFGPYCAKASTAEKKKLYDALEAQNKIEIEKFRETVEDAYLMSRP